MNKPTIATGKTIEQRIKSFNRYRESFNPLKGLTIQKAVGLLEQYQRGEFADIMWTMIFIEQADPDLYALIDRRTSALSQMNWRIGVVEGIDEQAANEQVQHLKYVYGQIVNLSEAIEHLQMATFRGYSLIQKQRAGVVAPLSPTKLECLDPWRLVRDMSTMDWYWNQEGRQTNYRNVGEVNRLDPMRDGLIVMECKRNLLRIALLKFIRASLSEKDWDAFVEIYGIPSTVVIAPENVPATDKDKYEQAAEQVAEGGSGCLPHGSVIQYPDSVRGVSPFKQRLDHLSEKLILAGTGGMLTMLTQPGSGTLAGGAHQETFELIAKKDARNISEIFQRAIDVPEIKSRFPGQPVMAYFELKPVDQKDVTQIADHYSKLHAAGLDIDREQMSEMTGYTLTPAPAQPVQPMIQQPDQQMSNRAVDSVDGIMEPVLKAIGGDLEPLRERVQKLMAIDDPEMFRAELIRLRADLPSMITMTEQAETELANLLASAWANGIEEYQ